MFQICGVALGQGNQLRRTTMTKVCKRRVKPKSRLRDSLPLYICTAIQSRTITTQRTHKMVTAESSSASKNGVRPAGAPTTYELPWYVLTI